MELTYRIDCRELTSRAAAHDCFARVFSLPASYGRNLDALYDVLTDLPPCTLILEHIDCLYGTLGPYAEKLLDTFRDAALEQKYSNSRRYQNFLSIFWHCLYCKKTGDFPCANCQFTKHGIVGYNTHYERTVNKSFKKEKSRRNSMEIQTGALVIVLAYMVGMMIIGYVVGKINIKGSADYLVAGRRMGLFMVAFSLSANNIGGGSTTGLAQKAFGAWGISAIWYVLAASLAMIPLAYFAPKIRKTMAVTIPEVVGRRFGKVSSNFTAVLSVLSLFCLTSSQIGASGAVINALIPSIPLNVCLLLAGFVTIFYTTFGGMIADQVSDLIQFGIILVGLAIATPIVLKHAGGWAAISAALPGEKLNMTQIGWASIIGYFFNYFCTFLCGPEMVSRFETCKDEKTAVRASFLCAILMAAMAIFPTLLGLAAFALKDQLPSLAENGSNAMMVVTGTYAPGIITGLISAAIICATMSSADSNLLCMSTMIINDIYPGFGGKKKLNDKQTIFYTRLCNVIAALIAMCISMFGVSLVAMNTFAFGIRCAGPFAAYGLGLAVPKATKNSGLISIFTGTIAFVVWQLLSNGGTLWFMMPVVFGSLVSVITFYVVNLIEWKRGVPAAPSAYAVEKAK